MVAREALASQQGRWLIHPLRPFLHLWMLSPLTVHFCNPFFDNFLAGVICSPPRDCWLGNPREFTSLGVALEYPQLLRCCSNSTRILDVSEWLSCCSFGDVSLANHFHIPLSPAPTGVSKNRSTQYTPTYGSKSGSRAWNHRSLVCF